MDLISKYLLNIVKYFTTLKAEHAVRFILALVIIYLLWKNNSDVKDIKERLSSCELKTSMIMVERDSIYNLYYIEKTTAMQKRLEVLETALKESRDNKDYAKSLVKNIEKKMDNGN